MNHKFIFLSLFITLITLSSFTTHAQGDSEERHYDDDTHFAAIIKIDGEDAIAGLEEKGVTVLRQRDNLLLCFLPLSLYEKDNSGMISRKTPPQKRLKGKVDEIKGLAGVIRIEPSRKVSRSMDVGRQWFDAYTIHSGEAASMPYTGKGVVTGICDIGIDPFHIAFLDENGKSRIKRIVQYKEGTAERIVLENEEDYRKWKTDCNDEWHATHVANIMAGSASPYSGMAPGSEIVVTTSRLTDVGLLCGAEDILDYAKESGKKAVINMSMANYLGPHDGSSLFSQYIDRIAEEAVVVLSAGNGGNTDFTLPYTFSEECRSVGLPLYSSDWVQFTPYGAVDIWSADERRFSVRFGVQDGERKEIEWMYPWQELTGGNRFTVSSDPSVKPDSDKEDLMYDPRLGDYFSGWFSLKGETDKENGRYRVIMEFDAKTDIVSSNGPWARYLPVVEVKGEPSVHVDIYADCQHTNFRSLPNGPKPGSLLSFSDLACGFNTISVGMFTNRDFRPSLTGEDIRGNHPAGAVSPYSSYSTLHDGRVMPQTVAPGGAVISAISTPFLEENPGISSVELNAVTNRQGINHYWASNTGTSMSAPYVAGSIACWLEAVPGLSPSDIREIIASTNRHDYPDADNPRHGSGWFDAVAGLKKAITKYSGIESVSSDGDSDVSLKLSFNGTALTVWNPKGDEKEIEVYNATGIKVMAVNCRESIHTIPLDGLSSGIYIARIANTEKSLRFIMK